MTYLEHNIQLEEALKLINQSLSIKGTFSATETKARILAGLNRYREAVETGKQALEMQKTERNAYTNMQAFQLRRDMENWRKIPQQKGEQ